MSTKKSRKRRLKSDQSYRIDKRGLKRIGGRFASKRQVAAWKSARKRRGLTTDPVETHSPASIKKHRSDSAKLAVLTRSIKSLGIYIDRVWEHPVYKVDYFAINIPVHFYTTDNFKNILQKTHDYAMKYRPDTILCYPVIYFLSETAESTDDVYTTYNPGFYIPTDTPQTSDKLLQAFIELYEKYQGPIIAGYEIVFATSMKSS